MDKLPLTNASTSASPHWGDLTAMAAIAGQNNLLPPLPNPPSWPTFTPPPPPPPSLPPPLPLPLSLPPLPSTFRANRQMEETLILQKSGEPEQLPEEEDEEEEEELGAMKEMMYKIAAMQPVEVDPATLRRPKRRNVRISDDPQSVAARHRRERISEKIRILQRLVPGGTKLDTASMLDEAIRYVKFLKRQIRHLQQPITPPLPTPPPPPPPCPGPDICPAGEMPMCFSFNEG